MIDIIAAGMRHPLTLLLIGALITGFAVPAIAREWQSRQKALEVKIALVAELSEATMTFMMANQFIQVGAASFSQANFDEAYKDWEIRSAVLGTKLRAYVGETKLDEEWGRFSDAFTWFYGLAAGEFEGRARHVTELHTLLGTYLSDKPNDEWLRHKGALLRWKSAIIEKLMSAKIRLEA